MRSGSTLVFFYGWFMDAALLREKGARPRNRRLAWVDGYRLVIRARASLVADPPARAHGVVMTLTDEELDRLYAEPGVRDYRPEKVRVGLADGGTATAVCYNIVANPAAAPNPEYLARWKIIAAEVGLPADFIAAITEPAAPTTPAAERPGG